MLKTGLILRDKPNGEEGKIWMI